MNRANPFYQLGSPLSPIRLQDITMSTKGTVKSAIGFDIYKQPIDTNRHEIAKNTRLVDNFNNYSIYSGSGCSSLNLREFCETDGNYSRGKLSSCDSYHRNGFYRSFSFFIDWYRRPRLRYEEAVTREKIVRFKVGKKEGYETRKINILSVLTMNVGINDAIEPKINLSFTKGKEKKEVTGVINLNKDRETIEIIPIETFSDNPSDEEYALSILRRGFVNVDKINGQFGRQIVLGFVFEDSKNFFLCRGLCFFFTNSI